MNYLLICSLVTHVALANAFAQNQIVTADPVAYYRAEVDFQLGDKIYKMDVDLNNDGRSDIIISKTVHSEDGFGDTNNLPWEIFLLRADGTYASAGHKSDAGINYGVVASFRKSQYWIGIIPEIGRFGVLHMVSGQGDQAKCQLHALIIEGESFRDVLIGEALNAEANYEQLALRFPKPLKPPVQELTP
ncbi:hypothetical protein BH11VER1_BH11VER1_39980 [soil metagenome]